MERDHEVLLAGEPVGKAEVLKQGLYYRIVCRCRIGNGEVCRLIVSWSDGWENLGIPVPEGDGFILRKKIPAKHIGEGDIQFRLLPVGQDVEELLFPKNTQPEENTEEPEAVTPQEEVPREEVSQEEVPQEEVPQEEIPRERPWEELPRQAPPTEQSTQKIHVLIQEDVPFEPLDRLEMASLGYRDGQAVAVFPDAEDPLSDVQQEPDGTVV